MFWEVIWSFFATLGFGIIFNVRDENLFFSALGGALGWLFYSLTLNQTGSEIIGMFIASIVISTYSEILARVLKNPVTLFLVCALIPLVPGSGMYNTVFSAVEGRPIESINYLFTTLSLAGVIAVGIILVSTLSRLTQKIMARNSHFKKLQKSKE